MAQGEQSRAPASPSPAGVEAIHSPQLLLADAFIDSKVGATPRSRHWPRAPMGQGWPCQHPGLSLLSPGGPQPSLSSLPPREGGRPRAETRLQLPGLPSPSPGAEDAAAGPSPHRCGKSNSGAVPGGDGARGAGAVLPRKAIPAGVRRATSHGTGLRACCASPGSLSLRWCWPPACCGGGGRWA